MTNRVKPIVADRHGSCVAVICPACTRAFIVSATLDRDSGRDCPHCEMYTATVSDGSRKLTIV